MDQDFWTPGRSAGVLLTLSILVPAAIFVILVIRGEMGGANAPFRGVTGIAEPPGAGLRRGRLFFVPAAIVLLVGYNLLTIQLQQSGDGILSNLGLNLMLFMVMLHILEQTFHSIVTTWALEETTQSGSVPPLYEQLRRWATPAMQHAYMLAGMLATALYGWAILQTGLLPGWIGWLSIGWGLLWIVLTLVAGEGFPLALYILPFVIGIALLVQS
jgi:hypothetical protein